VAVGDIVTTVRLQVLQTTSDTSRVPDATEVAQALGLAKDAVMDAYRQLHDGHVFVLEPGSTERLRMANPFSAVPTSFRVHIGDRSWWGNCVWDGLGIIAALGGRGVLATTCADCGQPEAVSIADSQLPDGSGIGRSKVDGLETLHCGYASNVQTASGRWMRRSRLSSTRK
jgi:hypothetical protein